MPSPFVFTPRPSSTSPTAPAAGAGVVRRVTSDDDGVSDATQLLAVIVWVTVAPPVAGRREVAEVVTVGLFKCRRRTPPPVIVG